MKILFAAIFTIGASVQGFCQAQTKPPVPDYGGSYNSAPTARINVAPTAGPRCPWMNLGTAAGFLGGDVTVSLTKNTAGEVTDCRFTRIAGPGELAIQVVVPVTVSAYRQRAGEVCSAKPVALRAIGNEAVECRLPGAALVIGRVRDQQFLIKLSGESNDAAAINAREAAEQVSGNLF